MSPHRFLGALLIKHGVIDADGLARAMAVQSPRPTSLGRILEHLGLASEDAVAKTIAEVLHLDHLDGAAPPSTAELTALLPIEFCKKRGVLAIGMNGNVLRLAVSDPSDYSIIQDVEFLTGKQAVPVAVTQTWLETALGLRSEERAAAYELLEDV